MSEEEKKAIEYFTKRIDICNENANICDENDFDEEATQLREEQAFTETILNLIQSQQKEIEKMKKLINNKNKRLLEYAEDIAKKDKMVDLILEEIAFDYDINSITDIATIKKQLKEKFEKKVEGKQC